MDFFFIQLIWQIKNCFFIKTPYNDTPLDCSSNFSPTYGEAWICCLMKNFNEKAFVVLTTIFGNVVPQGNLDSWWKRQKNIQLQLEHLIAIIWLRRYSPCFSSFKFTAIFISDWTVKIPDNGSHTDGYGIRKLKQSRPALFARSFM